MGGGIGYFGHGTLEFRGIRPWRKQGFID